MTTQPRYYASARGSYAGEVANAVRDFSQSFKQTPLWAKLAWNDILHRYRGSILGPFWIVLTNLAFVLGIGLVYSKLMHAALHDYVPWIATGVVVWNLFATSVMEGGDAFVSQGVIIRQSSTPLPLFVWRVVLRNLINFAHQLVVVIGVAVYFGYLFQINLPMAALGLVLIVLNLTWIVMILAVVSARYRDLQQGVVSLVQMLFFLSPVIWFTHQARASLRILEVNPVYHMLEALRNPLIGQPVPLHSLAYLAIMVVAGWIVAFLVYAGVRRRVVHYL